MKKAVLISVFVALVLAFAALIGAIVYVDHRFSKPFATFTTTAGEIGDLRIGESKLDLLNRLTTQSFSIEPKPAECPIVWIEVATMSDVYRTCLLNSDRWEESGASTAGLCKGPSNAFTRLTFKEGRLDSVLTECFHPE